MYSAADQSHPRAVEILEAFGENLHDPDWPGISDKTWLTLTEHPAEIVELMQIWKDDFPTFAATIFIIAPKGKPAGPFLFNRPQRIMWEVMVKLNLLGLALFLVILKARQLGISTFLSCFTFWNMWREKDFKALIMAHEVKLVDHINGMMAVAYDHLPDISGIKPKLRQLRQGARVPRSETYFSDRRSGTIVHVAKNFDPRGGSVKLIWQSEKAFYPDAKKLDNAMLPQLPTLGSVARIRSALFRETTPNGQNDFYEEYMAAEPMFACQEQWGENKEAEDKAIFLPWMIHDEVQFGGYALKVPPGVKWTEAEKHEQKRLSKIRQAYDGQEVSKEQMYWRRKTIEGKPYYGDEDLFNAEYPSDDRSCFLLSSDNAFKHVIKYLDESCNMADDMAQQAWLDSHWKVKTDGPIVGDMFFEGQTDSEGHERSGPLTKIKFVQNPRGKLIVWEPPLPGEKYVAALDPCNGVPGGDDASISVYTVRNCRQVAEWAGNLNPIDATDMLCAIGRWYNDCLINAEINIHGWTITERPKFRQYHNCYHWVKFDEGTPTKKIFWQTNPWSRNMLFTNMMRWYEQEAVSISSKKLLKELSTFEKDTEAEDVDASGRMQLHAVYRQQKHQPDDRVMATAIALITLKQVYLPSMEFTPFQKPASAGALGLQDRAVVQASFIVKDALAKGDKAQELIAKLTDVKMEVSPWNLMRAEQSEYKEPW